MLTSVMVSVIRYICLLGILLTASITDIKQGKIYNWLTFPSIFVGVAVNLLFTNITLFQNLFFLGLVFLLCFIPGLGMGDIKLIMTVGIWSTPMTAFVSVAISSLLVLLHAWLQRPFLTPIQVFHSLHHPFQPSTTEKTKSNSAPFAPYLSVAFLLATGGFWICTTYCNA